MQLDSLGAVLTHGDRSMRPIVMNIIKLHLLRGITFLLAMIAVFLMMFGGGHKDGPESFVQNSCLAAVQLLPWIVSIGCFTILRVCENSVLQERKQRVLTYILYGFGICMTLATALIRMFKSDYY